MEESLEELRELASTAGASVAEVAVQQLEKPNAATLIGAGKARELANLAAGLSAGVVIFDQDLTPTQQRNLEEQLQVKVIDRTQLILDIFASRARTREGRMQVELAQLSYLLPRLTGQGTSLSRLGGGIGTRGPGETKLETDRRRIAKRIKKIEGDLENVRAGRSLHRSQRQSVPLPTLALVGYTNAGKSTLFNRLSNAGVAADSRMFATLDPTVRGLMLPSRRRALLSDTVGFIRNLPTTLVKAFRATLEEVKEATLILHVVDVSSAQAGAQTAQVLKVLSEIGATEIPQVLVLNKADLLPPGEADVEILRRRLLGDAGGKLEFRAVLIGALSGFGVDRLLETIDEVLPFDTVVSAHFRVPMRDAQDIALLHERGRIRQIRYGEDFCEIQADVSESLRRRLERHLAPEST
ncbi:MAG: GTP-binding protein HSR1-related [Bryobacterales bacterium]|nr:GTP-binding protein HSR1-related [Bryobacterales bacterium]